MIRGFDPEFLDQLKKDAASEVQTYILQRVIRSIDSDSHLSRHSSTLAGLAIELPSAEAALLGHGKVSQPKVGLLSKICANAQASALRAAAFDPGSQLLADAVSILSSVETTVIQVSNKPQRQAGAIALASRLNQVVEAIPALIKKFFTEAWNISKTESTNWERVAFVCDEVSCLLASLDRDAEALEWQLRLIPVSARLDAEVVFDVLLPKAKRYYVACKVMGARRFRELSALEPSAQQSSALDGGITWAGAPEALRKFLAEVPANSNECAISIEVETVDRRSAARLGRRRITELLDQYVAGHRLIRLSIGAETLAACAGASAAEVWLPRGESPAIASPLVVGWPKGLREGLRMAHLARQSDSPLATAALSWSALEACGMEHQHAEDLSRAISLQALRQQIIESHRIVLDSIQAHIKYARSDVRSSARQLEKHKRGIARIPPDHPARVDLESRIETATQCLDDSQRHLEALENSLEKPLSAVNDYAVSNETNHLIDLDTWLNLLLPEKSTARADLKVGKSAIDALLPELSPLAARHFIDWRRRLTTTPECSDWLTLTQKRIEALVDALYRARNSALHNGAFSATGDAALGIGGTMLVDLTLEFLGNWYRSVMPNQSHKVPLEIIREISSRQENIIRKLNVTTRPGYELNVSLLTSPLSNGWDRK